MFLSTSLFILRFLGCYVIQQKCHFVLTCNELKHEYVVKNAVAKASKIQDNLEKANNVLYVNNDVLLEMQEV